MKEKKSHSFSCWCALILMAQYYIREDDGRMETQCTAWITMSDPELTGMLFVVVYDHDLLLVAYAIAASIGYQWYLALTNNNNNRSSFFYFWMLVFINRSSPYLLGRGCVHCQLDSMYLALWLLMPGTTWQSR